MPKRLDDDARFEEVVSILVARAKHLLERETRLGSTLRLTGKARIGDDELRERLLRLRHSLRELSDDFRVYWKEGGHRAQQDEIWSLLANSEASLAFERFSALHDTDIEKLLERLWEALDMIMYQLELATQEAVANLPDHTLAQLSPEERAALQELTSDELKVLGNFPKINPDLDLDIACLSSLYDASEHCRSETLAILAGRFHGGGGRGAPEKIRGQRLAVQLLGMAEGLGLFTTRNHGNRHSGIDAVILAFERSAGVNDPTARILLGETPKTHDTFARRVLVKCRDDEILLSDRRLGCELGKRIRQHRT